MKAGINKFLSSQMLPGCFYLVTSDDHQQAAAATRRRSNNTIIRLIMSDGRVKSYERPVAASELMGEFPKHMVCHSDSFCIGRKVPALSADDLLQPGHNYFLLPAHFFQSVLSFVSIASSFAKARGSGAAAAAPLLRSFEVHRTPAGELKIRVSIEEFVDNNKIRGGRGGAIQGEDEEEEEEAMRSRVCTTDALEKDYKALVRCKSQQWKPKLETIKEYDRKRSFGRIRRKITNQDEEQHLQHKHQQQHHKILFPPPPPPPPPPSPLCSSSSSSSLKKSRWKGKIVSVK